MSGFPVADHLPKLPNLPNLPNLPLYPCMSGIPVAAHLPNLPDLPSRMKTLFGVHAQVSFFYHYDFLKEFC